MNSLGLKALVNTTYYDTFGFTDFKTEYTLMLARVVLRQQLSGAPASRHGTPADVAGWPAAALGPSADPAAWPAVLSGLLPGGRGLCTLGHAGTQHSGVAEYLITPSST